MDSFPASEDALLVAAARAGGRAAFAEIYRRHGAAVYGLALRLLGEPAAAQDLAHDVFLRALDRLDDLRDANHLRAWLKRATANGAIDQLRARRPGLELAVLDTLTDGEPDLAEAARLPPQLDRLPAPLRLLLWLHVVEGWTHAELAQRFGRSESWSKSAISRGLQRLRESTSQNGDCP